MFSISVSIAIAELMNAFAMKSLLVEQSISDSWRFGLAELIHIFGTCDKKFFKSIQIRLSRTDIDVQFLMIQVNVKHCPRFGEGGWEGTFVRGCFGLYFSFQEPSQYICLDKVCFQSRQHLEIRTPKRLPQAGDISGHPICMVSHFFVVLKTRFVTVCTSDKTDDLIYV
jgi:hypothetical protein